MNTNYGRFVKGIDDSVTPFAINLIFDISFVPRIVRKAQGKVRFLIRQFCGRIVAHLVESRLGRESKIDRDAKVLHCESRKVSVTFSSVTTDRRVYHRACSESIRRLHSRAKNVQRETQEKLTRWEEEGEILNQILYLC